MGWKAYRLLGHLLHHGIRLRLRIHVRVEHLLPTILLLLLLWSWWWVRAHLLLVLGLRHVLLFHARELRLAAHLCLLLDDTWRSARSRAGRWIGVRSHCAELWPSLVLRRRVLPRYNIDEEVEHIALRQRRCNVGALQRAALVLLRVDPGAHCQLGDEDVAALGEEDGGFCGYHLDFRVRLHHLLDTCEGELVELVVVRRGLKIGDLVLPVGVQDISVLPIEPL